MSWESCSSSPGCEPTVGSYIERRYRGRSFRRRDGRSQELGGIAHPRPPHSKRRLFSQWLPLAGRRARRRRVKRSAGHKQRRVAALRAATCGGLAAARAGAEEYPIESVKAAFLYRFTAYVELARHRARRCRFQHRGGGCRARLCPPMASSICGWVGGRPRHCELSVSGSNLLHARHEIYPGGNAIGRAAIGGVRFDGSTHRWTPRAGWHFRKRTRGSTKGAAKPNR
jgi:hypothetical protein